jgi:hypothetical protein|eukprot:COSAG06_NODE_4939_length_3846_cov_1.922338_5_plen_89_part_00
MLRAHARPTVPRPPYNLQLTLQVRGRSRAAASLRMGNVPDMDPSWAVREGGKGLAEPAMLDYQLAVLTELIVDWGVDGVELDFAAPVR